MESCITEAVHLIMEIGRFGCKDSGIVKSRKAVVLIHGNGRENFYMDKKEKIIKLWFDM